MLMKSNDHHYNPHGPLDSSPSRGSGAMLVQYATRAYMRFPALAISTSST